MIPIFESYKSNCTLWFGYSLKSFKHFQCLFFHKIAASNPSMEYGACVWPNIVVFNKVTQWNPVKFWITQYLTLMDIIFSVRADIPCWMIGNFIVILQEFWVCKTLFCGGGFPCNISLSDSLFELELSAIISSCRNVL